MAKVAYHNIRVFLSDRDNSCNTTFMEGAAQKMGTAMEISRIWTDIVDIDCYLDSAIYV